MNLVVAKASIEERGIVAQLLQRCLLDCSTPGRAPNRKEGEFGYPWLELYWTSPRRHPYLLRFENQLAGFVFVRSKEEDEIGEWQWQIAEFFVLHALRGRKVGTTAARAILRSRPGVWQVSYDSTRDEARNFWASVARSIDPAAKPRPVAPGRERYLLVTREANPLGS